MKRTLITAPVALLTFLIGLTIQSVWRIAVIDTAKLQPPPPPFRLLEENAVYAALLRGRASRQSPVPLLIQSQTIPTMQDEFSEGFFFEYTAPEGLSYETFQDYREVDREVRTLTPELVLDHPYVRVDEPLVKNFFHTYEGRKVFGKHYPDSEGIMLLSRVGFNKGMNEALVYRWLYCGGLCGDGGYVLLRKTSAGWKVISSNLWIS